MGARQGQGEAAQVFDGGDDGASSPAAYSAATALAWTSSPKTRAKMRSTFLKW